MIKLENGTLEFMDDRAIIGVASESIEHSVISETVVSVEIPQKSRVIEIFRYVVIEMWERMESI